jgi:hypothetical protein
MQAVRNLARSWIVDLKGGYNGLGLSKEHILGFVDVEVDTIRLERVGTTDEIAKGVSSTAT